jgi:hypothetical protein
LRFFASGMYSKTLALLTLSGSLCHASTYRDANLVHKQITSLDSAIAKARDEGTKSDLKAQLRELRVLSDKISAELTASDKPGRGGGLVARSQGLRDSSRSVTPPLTSAIHETSPATSREPSPVPTSLFKSIMHSIAHPAPHARATPEPKAESPEHPPDAYSKIAESVISATNVAAQADLRDPSKVAAAFREVENARGEIHEAVKQKLEGVHENFEHLEKGAAELQEMANLFGKRQRRPASPVMDAWNFLNQKHG